MENEQLIKFLTWPGSTPIERIADEEIIRLREEVERLSVWKQRWRDVACKLRVQLSNCGTMESELTRARMERDSWRRVAEKLMSERGEVNDE